MEIQQKTNSLNNMTSRVFFSATEITPNIYLGDYESALDAKILLDMGIKRILNVSKECLFSESILENEIKTMQIFIDDHCDESIEKYFQLCIDYIHEGVMCGEKILVYCRMGISRSATIVIAYLMRYGINGSHDENPLSYDDAFDFVREKREDICPNLGFIISLHQWDIVGDKTKIFKF
jgi:hypothetical protein